MQTLISDLRYAARQLRKSPGFALIAIITLALGIGSNIAVLTLINGILLRPLPLGNPEQLVDVHNGGDGGFYSLSYSNLVELQRRTGSKMDIAMDGMGGTDANIVGFGGRLQIHQDEVTANLPQVLGVQPALGRTFRTEENDPGKNHVLLLSDSVWRRVFLADPRVIGATVSIRETPYVVIGVMPKGFSFPADTSGQNSVWSPAELGDNVRADITSESQVYGSAIARLPAGISATQVAADLSRAQAQISATHSGREISKRIAVVPYQKSLNEDARKPLMLLYGVAVAIWALACLNVTSLMLARAISQRREQAVRSALGATRARLIRQSVTESLLISTMGSVAGMLTAQGTIKLLWRPITRNLPMTNAVHVDWRVVLLLVALTLLTAVIVGFIPALRTMRRDVQHDLQGGRTQTASAAHNRLRGALVVAQLAITVVLLTGAGLFLRTVRALREVPLGFTQQNVLTGGIILHSPRRTNKTQSPDKQPDMVHLAYQPLLDRLRAMPGVRAVALSSVLPMRPEFRIMLSANLDGKKLPSADEAQAEGRVASPGLVDALGIPILRGRFFTDADTPASPVVVVINQAFADKYLKNQNPIEHTLSLGDGRFGTMQIIGVIGDVKQGKVDNPTSPEMYLGMNQITPGSPFYGVVTAFMEVAIRASVPADSLRAQFEKALNSVAPDATTTDVKTIRQAVEDSFGSTTLTEYLMEGFAGLALIIASVGLYGLLAFTVALRTQEIGVRLALGASRVNVMGLVLRRAVLLIGMGLGTGCIAAWFAVRVAQSYLFGVKAHDAVTFVVVLAVLGASGLLAAYLPARRASAIDPMQALRAE
ncbi:ABC transporter permease [Acidicapsa ligni]|uniref:ABC transporter permease n=1 Tax=Acidicapsa ligni TaxID=542300 RepID=UPI0021E08399|nr:ABC transporter permease [Acidicapsa ligni]